MKLNASALRTSAVLAMLIAPMTHAQSPTPPQLELAVVDRDGQRDVLGSMPPGAYAPRISPDGSRVVFDVFGQANEAAAGSIWIAPIDDLGARRELPPGGATNLFPIWSADGESVLYISDAAGEQALFSRPADGSGVPVRLVTARAPEAWTDGGKTFSFITFKENDYAVWTWSIEDGSEAPLIELPGSQHSTYFSPDGRWVTYASNDTGGFEVWVEPVPPTGDRHRVTDEGGAHPLWSRDGDEIFFDRDGRLFAVEVDTGAGFSSGEPQPLPIEGFVQEPNRRQFDLMPEGDRFLMMFPAPD